MRTGITAGQTEPAAELVGVVQDLNPYQARAIVKEAKHTPDASTANTTATDNRLCEWVAAGTQPQDELCNWI